MAKLVLAGQGTDWQRQAAAGGAVYYSIVDLGMEKEEITISADRSKLDLKFIHTYLSTDSYWAKGIPYEKVVTAADHSLNFGIYHGDRQVGYARIVTDYARIAYLADVFVIEGYRGRGLSKQLIGVIMAHPALRGLRRWMLHTLDAHGLYEQFGWNPPAKPETYLEIYNPAADWWAG